MSRRVLVVDDEKLIVKGIRFSLEQDGYDVDCAYDGEEALKLAKENAYDIILLDVMLPKYDGFEVCQQIREYSDVPIIMLTAKGDDMDKILGLDYGADDYITKPFNILEVKATSKGPKILVSRTHPELVKRLFESEVAEVKDGTVEIKSIAREAGSRTKLAVWSNDPDVDPVGACVGVNGARVSAIVNELRGEKIDIINWSDNPAILIENALSPAKVISVMADPDEKIAGVIVPDYQLSLAIGKEGQNARLAARLTGYKIDIKSETQAIECGDLPENYMEQMGMVGEEGYTVGEEEEEYDDVPADAADEDGADEIEFVETDEE